MEITDFDSLNVLDCHKKSINLGVTLIKEANKILLGTSPEYDIYKEKPFIVTTQNLQYLEKTGAYQAKRVFCILGSADPIIQMATKKVLDLVAIDLNSFQIPVYFLKMACLQGLTNMEIESLLYNFNNNEYYSSEIFQKCLPFFKEEEMAYKIFWNYLIEVYGKDLANGFIKGGVELQPVDKIRMAIPFLKKKEAYRCAKENLQKSTISVKTSEALTWLQSHPEEKFDYIDITNILLFIYQGACENKKEKFVSILNKLQQIYDRNLIDGGTFVLDYMFRTDKSSLEKIDSCEKSTLKYVREIYQIIYNELQKIFVIETFAVESVLNFYGSKIPLDMVVMTRKR